MARKSLADDLIGVVKNKAGTPLLCRRSDDGWTDVSAEQFLAEVRSVAKGLVAAGIEAGDRVGILSRTRYEWTLIDYAIWFAGAVTVPIYETSSAEQIEWILGNSGTKALFVESSRHAERVKEVQQRLVDLTHVWTIDEDAVGTVTATASEVTDDQLESRRSRLTPDSAATIIYTSGTTGRPKGCVLTHGNFIAELDGALHELHELFEAEDASTLLFLPLAHVFARVIQIGVIRAGVRLAHSPDIKGLLADLDSFKPTFVLGVPRVFEKVYNTASQKAVADGKGRVFQAAATTAIRYSEALDTGRRGPFLRAKHRLFDRLVYGKLRDALGGRCRYAVSGGAPLGERLGHFYRGIGLIVLEGYGLTETTAAVTVNSPSLSKLGTVGRPLPGTSVRTADDGELLVRGGQVFPGYWKDDEQTAQVLDDQGWLHTGDLGEIDEEGFVSITGRKKEILVTAGGKNVSPAVLEDRLRGHPLVSQCMVVGDGRPFIGALVTLDREALDLWADRHDKPRDIETLADDPDLRAEVQQGVDDANQAVSRAEAIRAFRVLTEDWTEEGGQLTPSLKVKRAVVLHEWRAEVEALYDRS